MSSSQTGGDEIDSGPWPEVLYCSDCDEVCCGDWTKEGIRPRQCDHYGIEHEGCGGTMYPRAALATLDTREDTHD